MRFLAAFLLAFFAANAAQAFDACAPEGYTPIASRYAHALLFRIERCGQPSSYLMGSIHSDDANAHARAAPAFALINNVSAAGFEYLEPANAADIAAKAMFDAQPGAKLSKRLSAKQWAALRAQLETKRGMPLATIERLKPWAAAVMLQIPDAKEGGVILDDALKHKAQALGARLYGLETMEQQLAIFDGMSEAQQWAMLKDTLTNLKKVDETNARLMNAYANGNLGVIEELGKQGFAEIEDAALRAYLQRALLTQRNGRMEAAMKVEMNNESVLSVVGALHLPGPEGILQTLEKDGYYLFPIEK